MSDENGLDRKLSLSFWALNVSQFLGAMNDNAYRWVVVLALIARVSDKGESEVWPMYAAGVIFSVPFILFSSAAGILADRFSKQRLIIVTNAIEVVVMSLGLGAFLLDSPILIYSVLFLMLTQSTFFSPGKLGILPEIVPREKLSHANGLMEMFTYLAIIFGTIGGTYLYKLFGASSDVGHASTHSCWRASVVFIAIAMAGLLVSLLVRDTGVRASAKRGSPWFWKEVARNLRACQGDRYLLLSLFAIAFFLFLGSFVQMNVTPYGIETLGWDRAVAPNLFLVLAVGIGLGSYLAGRLSGRVIEIGFVPVGAGLVSLSALAFVLPVHTPWLAIPLLLLLGIGGGFYIVPLNAFLQQRAPEHSRGELIATANFLSFCGVLLSAGFLFGLDNKWVSLTPGLRFGVIGLLTLVLTVYVIWLLPDFLIRFVGLIVTRLLYRLQVVGREHVPLEGGALLVCNHVSYVDAALVGATHQRRIRFVMAREFYEHPWFNWLFRLMQAIPISSDDPPKKVVESLKNARQALDEGYLVCIFAEGEVTRTGAINEFRRGFERIVRNSDYPVIPANLHGIWGSTFSFYDGMPLGRWPRWGRRITVSFGAPLPATTGAFEIRQAVLELQTHAFERDRVYHESLPLEFVQSARANWGRFCMSDTLGKELTYGRTLAGALALGRALEPEVAEQPCVGLLMPTSVGGALANLAVSFLGKVPVNLNYTASPEAVGSALQQCGIERIVTSRAFLEKLGAFSELPGLIFLEDVAKGISRGSRLRAFLKARLLPARFLVKNHAACPLGTEGATTAHAAAVLFSSGSTGRPKGVVLTHYNIVSNVRAIQQVFRTSPRDVMCGSLPFFHAFGLTDTLWLPLLAGFGAAYHPNPLDGARIGQMVAERKCTLLVATPTFLLLYIRKVAPEQFASLRIVIAGAEKLKPRIAATFEKRFGIEPMEGYGATELSPVAAVNHANVEVAGVRQVGHRPGTIGRPIPGVTMKVVDPSDPTRDLGFDADGLLLVKGPNVMRGYLGDPERTTEVIRDGWYITGDVARITHDGFVAITDRLSRFSKIAGEMVPHLAVEEKIQELLGASEQVCAVTSVPDEKRGERLVALLTPAAGDPVELHRRLKSSDLPNLWLPSLQDFRQIEAIPLLGSGKMDLKALKELAGEN